MQPKRHFQFCGMILAAGLMVVAASQAQTNQVRNLPLSQAVQEALEHNFDIKIQRYEPLVANQQLRLARADYDPTLNLNTKRSYTQDPTLQDATGTRVTGSKSTSDVLSGGITGQGPLKIRSLADYNKSLSLLRLREGTTLSALNIDVRMK